MCFNTVNLARLQAARASRRAQDTLLLPGIGGAFTPALPDGNLASDGADHIVNVFPGTAADFIADGGFANDVVIADDVISPSVVGGEAQTPSPSDAKLVRCPNCGEWISITQPYGSCPGCSGEPKKK
ncbi:hypothetical protein EV715DRAFT_287805 [Schizophyllum commune]